MKSFFTIVVTAISLAAFTSTAFAGSCGSCGDCKDGSKSKKDKTEEKTQG